ncbi:YicC/YloC family endoribonuclease [Oceanotoga teriensis]|uniref:YicC/YloC family endoribonuclease n=1 Tax=Oceanotoga teriensis TaxID=515440 RepID=UPI002713E844|nr:YicC/YloC family endoribonuclease [Oceanotoga teriensis]MDO7976265.1 YicC family protein [Oceanotoga teriensis]
MRSMTGYGRIEKIINDYNYSVEIKSLNGKYSNLKTSIAGIFSPLEIEVQNLVKKYFKRGNISVYIDIRFLNPQNFVDIDLGLAKSYHSALQQMTSELHMSDDVSLDVLTKFREIIKIKVEEEAMNKIWKGLEEILLETIEKVKVFQIEEGEKLKTVLLGYIDDIEKIVNDIQNTAVDMKDTFKERLENNLKELLNNSELINEGRLELEVALLAERADISEEIERLKSHIKKFRNIVNSEDELMGQNLDFLSQEMHREFNTIASKSKLIELTNLSVEGRGLVNKIREQVQNVH